MRKKDFLSEWQVDEMDFPTKGTLEEQIIFCLRYAILAPSTHNTQPWLFKVNGDKCVLLMNKDIKLPEADPHSNYLYISMGCCLENIMIASDHYGIFKSCKYFDESDNKIAELTFKKYIGKKNNALLKPITLRTNARGFYKSKKIEERLISKLSKVEKYDGLSAAFITGATEIKKVADLTADAIGQIYSKKDFRKELSNWINSNFSNKKSGMPGYALKFTNLISLVFPTLLRLKDLSPVVSKVNRLSIVTMPLITVVKAKSMGKIQLVQAGQYIERLLLTLKANGVDSSIFIASLELNQHRSEIQKLIKSKETPVFIFGSGYVKGVPIHTPRVGVEDKLVN